MKQGLTEIVFILDRSGSMSGYEKDTIGGFNAFVEKQKEEPGEALLTTILFDDYYEVLHNGINIKDVRPLTEQDYYPRGMTALNDAVGKAIKTVGGRLNNTPEDERPEKVIFVITTDGEENSSQEYAQAHIKEMVQHQTEKYNWQFLFLGADLDAFSGADAVGVGKAFAASYTRGIQGPCGPKGAVGDLGIQSAYCSISAAVGSYRKSGTVDADWDKDLYNDDNK